MRPVIQDPRCVLLHGDSLQLALVLPEASIDAVVCDPPYELGFMGRKWDASGIAYSADLWRAVLRVLKPGGHLLAFGGTRTYHRMTCAIEDAGFEIRDCINYCYGSGFPKSLDVSKAIDARLGAKGQSHYTGPNHANAVFGEGMGGGHTTAPYDPATAAAAAAAGWGTALKPAHEPIALARKPLVGTVAANVLAHGTGALNIGACRIGTNGETLALVQSNPSARQGTGQFGFDQTAQDKFQQAQRESIERTNTLGRWPANFLLGHSAGCEVVGDRVESVLQNVNAGDEQGHLHSEGWGIRDLVGAEAEIVTPVYRCAPGCVVAELDRQSGASKSSKGKPRRSAEPGDGYGMTATGAEYDDAGGASRFFACFPAEDPVPDVGAGFLYCAKPSTREREFGCEHLPERTGGEATDREDGSAGLQSPRAGAGRRGGRKNVHPTCKPVSLMRYLCRLVTPHGGVVLDPFAGSGTTGIAALREGFSFVGVELTEEYLPITEGRLRAALAETEEKTK